MMAKGIAQTNRAANPARPWEITAKQKAALRKKQIAIGAGAGVLGVVIIIALIVRHRHQVQAGPPESLQASLIPLPTAGPPLIAIRIVNLSSDPVTIDRVLLNGEFAALAVDEREEASGFKREAFPAELHLGNAITVAVHIEGVPVEGELGTYYGKEVSFVDVITLSGTRRVNVIPLKPASAPAATP
jgi:hypothetical protein